MYALIAKIWAFIYLHVWQSSRVSRVASKSSILYIVQKQVAFAVCSLDSSKLFYVF